MTYVKARCTIDSFPMLYHAEKASIAGICIKQTCRAYAEPISMLWGARKR